jgi:RHS repeat-associated protein
MYDGADRILKTAQNSQTITYIYDIPGKKRTVTYSGGRVIADQTDFRSRMDHIDDAGSPPPIVQYIYDLANNVLSRNYRNSTTSSFTYNANNWTTNIAHNNPATFAGFNYAYDNEGNKQYEQKTHDTSHSECYGYDHSYRLTSYQSGTLASLTPCTVAPPPTPPTQTDYNLDSVGNWNSKTTNGVAQTRMHNSVNELIKIDSTNLIYDNGVFGNGNLTNDGTYKYQYDEESRLTDVTRISDSALVGHHDYDALGRRVQKGANPAGALTTTQYFYDGARIIEEQNALGVTQATYVYGNYVDEILAMDRGGQTYYYHQNALWSVEAVTNSTGSPVERYDYCGGNTLQCGDPYGSVSITDGSFNPIPANSWGTPHSAIGNPWMFTGRQFDEETGLYYYRARNYDSFKGRFLQRDTFELSVGENLYEYAQSSPTLLLDPSGNLTWRDKFGLRLSPQPILPIIKGLVDNLPNISDKVKELIAAQAAAIDKTLAGISPSAVVEITWQTDCPKIIGEPTFQTSTVPATFPGRITVVKESGWTPRKSEYLACCNPDRPNEKEAVDGLAATFKAEWTINANLNAQAGLSIVGSGGNVGGGGGTDFTIASNTAEEIVYADGFAILTYASGTQLSGYGKLVMLPAPTQPPPKPKQPAK